MGPEDQLNKPEDQLEGQKIQEVGRGSETVREQDKFQLVLAYLGLLSLIPLLTVKDSDFVRWHAKNGLILCVGGLLAISILREIPFVRILACVAVPALIVVDLMAMVKALRGIRWRIPLASDVADRF